MKNNEYCYFMVCRSNGGMLQGICKGYSCEYAKKMMSFGYEFISEAYYKEIDSKDLAISYDYE